MSGAKGTALEWALALLKAPAERHALRQSPLPPGIDRLLAVAAGVEPEESLAAIAASLGESHARLREAAQFYAREVLFHPQADAYRTLGVAADASPEQIKAQHRLLQLWLHPDRQQSEDDSVFAARVNIAWNRLRNEERRRAYDRDLAEEREALAEEARDDTEAMRRMAPAWLPAATPPQPAANPWRHRLPVVALAVVCLLLGWVAVRNSEREPERWEWAEAEQAAPEEPPTAEAVAAVEMKPPAQRPASMPVPTRPKPQQSPTVALIERPARALASLVGMAEQAQAPVAVQEVPPAPPVEVAPPPPSPPRLAMAARPALPKAAVATTVERQKPVRVALVAEAEPAPPPVKAASRPAPVPASTTAADGTAKPQPVAAAPAPVRAANEPNPARIEQARRVGAQLLQYLGKPKRAPPPIWNSPVIMSSADGLRHDLHSLGRARIGAPQWRIGNEAASFASDYRVDGIDGPEGRGVLTASMVWRENRWLVVGLGVEQAR